MARQNPNDIKKELEQLEDENYGDETISGTNPRPDADDDIDANMIDAVGSDFDEDKPLNLADEIEDDEDEIQGGEINNYEDDEEDEITTEPKDELLKIEKKEGLESEDPMDQVSDDDFSDEDEEDSEE